MSNAAAFIKKYWITAAIYAAMIFGYKIIADNGFVNAFLFPPIKQIYAAFSKDSPAMFLNLVSSFKLLIPSVAVSLVLALAIGTLLGINRKAREVLHPVVYTFSVVPSILLSPFALLLAPSFWAASLFLVVYGTVWATLFATITGIMTIDRRYLDKAATLELYGWKRLVRVILPAASPSILAGFVNSLRSSFVMLVYAEMYGAKYGMGYHVRKYADFGLYDRTWAGFVFMVVVLVIVMQIFECIKKYMLKWTISQ